MHLLRKIILTVTLLTLSLASLSATAQNNVIASNLIAQASAKNTAQHQTWIKLGHYETDFPLFSKVKSAIKTEDFFLSPLGKTDPNSELIATLTAFTETNTESADEHAQCKFRGRFIWLDQQLDFDAAGLVRLNCPNFENWSLDGKTTSISLVFATGYLANPASYYGHTLIKLNSSDLTGRTTLEDVSVNYGAIVPPNEGPLPYILKGLLGGYSGGFSHTQYYYHDHQYGENELRDLWEYELDLEQDEVNLLMGHTWEVLGKEYTYLFLSKNCAYQMAKIFEVIDGIKLLPEFSLWVMPQELIRNLYDSSLRGRPLIKKVDYQPSRQSRLYENYSKLNAQQKDVLSSASENIEVLNTESYFNFSDDEKAALLDTMIDYYQYVRDEDLLGDDANNKRYTEVLSKRFSLSPGIAGVESILPAAPHEGRNPSLSRITSIYNKTHGQGVRFTVRPAYYDSLDANSSHVRNAELKMGELTLGAYRSELYMQSLELFSVRSVQAKSTGLPGDNSKAWSIRLAVEQFSSQCIDCLISTIDLAYGLSKTLGNSFLIGSTLGASAHDNRLGIGNFSARWSVFANAELTQRLNMRLDFDKRLYADGSSRHRTDYKTEARYRTSQNTAVRAYYSKEISEEFGFSFDYYF